MIDTIDKIENACQNFKIAKNSCNPKFQKLDEWLDKESSIFVLETKNEIKKYKKYFRGQIIKVDFGINIGSELCYTHYAIIITKCDSVNSEVLTVVLITSKYEKNRVKLGKILHEAYPNSSKYNLECYANLTQITTISKKRIFRDKKEYKCNNDILNKIDLELKKMYTKN